MRCQPSTINTQDQKVPPSYSLRHFGDSTSLANRRKFTTPPENLRKFEKPQCAKKSFGFLHLPLTISILLIMFIHGVSQKKRGAFGRL